jgi:hypothetical protein
MAVLGSDAEPAPVGAGSLRVILEADLGASLHHHRTNGRISATATTRPPLRHRQRRVERALVPWKGRM